MLIVSRKKRPFHIAGDLEFASIGELLFILKEYRQAAPDMIFEYAVEALQIYLASSLLQATGFTEKFSLILATAVIGIKAIFYQTALDGKWMIYKKLFATPRHPRPFIHTLQGANLDEMEDIIADISDLEMPNNCFTWARKELAVADIYVERGWFPRTRNALA